MQIRNTTSGIILVGDLPGSQGGFGLSLPPGVDITLFNEDAEKSAQLNSFITGGQVSIVGTDEPSTGTAVSPASAVFDLAGSNDLPYIGHGAIPESRYGVALVARDLSAPGVTNIPGVVFLAGVSPSGDAANSYIIGASGTVVGPGTRGGVIIIGGNGYGTSPSIGNGGILQVNGGNADYSGGSAFLSAGESGGDAGVQLFLNSGDLFGGVSYSGNSAGTSVTAGQTLIIAVDGEAPQTITFPANLSGGVAIAAEIQALARALTADTPSNQISYSGFTAYFRNSGGGRYFLIAQGDQNNFVQASLVVSGGTAAAALKLGVSNGGFEGAPGLGGVGPIIFGFGNGGPNTIQCGQWDAINGFQIFGSPVPGQAADVQIRMLTGVSSQVGSIVLHDSDGSMDIDTPGQVRINGNPVVGGGASGSFTSSDGKTVTVTNGIITSIV